MDGGLLDVGFVANGTWRHGGGSVVGRRYESDWLRILADLLLVPFHFLSTLWVFCGLTDFSGLDGRFFNGHLCFTLAPTAGVDLLTDSSRLLVRDEIEYANCFFFSA